MFKSWKAVVVAVAGLLVLAAVTEAARRVPNQNGIYVAGIDSNNDQQIINVDSNGTQAIGGDVASGAADGSAKPIKVGCVNNTTPPTVTNTQRVDWQCDTRGNGFVVLRAGGSSISSGFVNADSLNPASFFGLAVTPFPNLFNGSNWDRDFTCASQATFSVANTTTEIVALSASTVVRVCSFMVSNATAGSFKFVDGTGTNCATSASDMIGSMAMADKEKYGLAGGNSSLFRGRAGRAICLTAVTGTITGQITYTQF